VKLVRSSADGPLQQHFDDAAGGALELHGYFPVTAPALWTQPCKIDARNATIIGQGCGGITISPDPSVLVTKNMWELVGPVIIPSVPGGPGDAIHIDLDLGQWLSKFTLKGATLGMFAGASVRQTKTGDSDGFFCSAIEDNIMLGLEAGLDLDNSGDSLVVARNTISGPGFGVRDKGMPGAALRVYEKNNITACKEAFVLHCANQTKILYNQIEAVDYTGDLDAMIWLDGFGCDLIGNNLNNHGHCVPIVIANGYANDAHRNFISVTSANPKPHYRLLAGADQSNDFSKNRWMVDGVLSPVPWVESASPHAQFNIWRSVALGGGWTPHSNAGYWQGLFCSLATDQSVSLRGSLAGGALAANTVVGTLPLGARPAIKTVRIAVRVWNGSTWATGQADVNLAGQIKIAQAFPANTLLVSFDAVRFATY
jgi:hypothetical protein